MLQRIASTYEIIEKLGSGGGGTVYLARHLRLKKKVVLKADKRKLSVDQELLRREVDILKELSHPHIPKVYDFFVEGEEVYTVMDYIEGESLDKALKRGETFSQSQVIQWANQLLDALSYLHSPIHGDPPRGFVHSDIKPANLMRTIQGDICLIDFNIALALGEENVIGCSAGYASPEHYGLDFSIGDEEESSKIHNEESGLSGLNHKTGGHRLKEREPETGGFGEDETDITVTLPISRADFEDDSLTLTMADPDSLKMSFGDVQKVSSPPRKQHASFRVSTASSGVSGRYYSGTSGKRLITPDVRSDIYSTGATLYHLLNGSRPSRNAKEVVQLSNKKFSPQVIKIISKAMDPNPDRRYQTADKMRKDFLDLRKNDSRMRRWKRQRLFASIVFSFFFAAGGAAAFIGLKRMQRMESWLNHTEASQKVLDQGDAETAAKNTLEILSKSTDQLIPEHVPGVQNVLTEALGVYDLSDGYKRYKTVDLPSPPLYLSIAPDGKKGSALCGQSVLIFDLVSGEITAELPAEATALSEIKYLDSKVILYAGQGGIKAYDTVADRELWTGEPAASICISGDGTYAAGIYEGDSFATIYDTRTGEVKNKVDFGGRQQDIAIGNNLFALNNDGSWLGASFEDGSVHMYDIKNPGNEIIIFDKGSEYTHFEGGFYNTYFAFSASNQDKSTFAVIDLENKEEKGGFQSESAFQVQTDESGIYVQSDQILVKIDPDTGEQTPLVNMAENILCFARCENRTVAASEKGIYFFDAAGQLISSCGEEYRSDFAGITDRAAVIGSMDKPVIRIMQYEENPDTEMFVYDPSYEHDEARISADEKSLMLFSYDQFRICGTDGSLIRKVELPDSAHVLDQKFIREEEGSFLEVLYDNGEKSVYSARDGELVREEKDDKSAGIPKEELEGDNSGEPDEGNRKGFWEKMDEEFLIDNLRIESPLHGTPIIYDAETGDEISRLKEDTYLTYVTKAGTYLVAQYITADGNCSGQLINDRGEVLAELPYLCDVIGENLIFDYPSGTIRKSKIYSVDELMDMAAMTRANASWQKE